LRKLRYCSNYLALNNYISNEQVKLLEHLAVVLKIEKL